MAVDGDTRRGGLEWRDAIGPGVLAHTLLVWIPTLLARVLQGNNPSSDLTALPAVVGGLVAPVVGGAVAGRRARGRSPLTHGAVTAAIAAGIVAAVTVVRRVATGHTVPVVTLGLLLCVDVVLGVAGAWFGFRRGLRASAPPEADL